MPVILPELMADLMLPNPIGGQWTAYPIPPGVGVIGPMGNVAAALSNGSFNANYGTGGLSIGAQVPV